MGTFQLSFTKSKDLLMLVYSAELRVNDVVRLTAVDINSKRKLILIRGTIGRKDRYTLLSEAAMEKLNLYIKSYQQKE